ncbi:hypothetical protein [Nonomuraea angiospora]|uniref:hypothetical protein n=1 Tax=Nonomuraea angiospora TaxID=46172 RepID=UPI0029A15749|nr:hypothetical protein [Nonomuraea angiospora]MDX3103856.1 hypothetical protein [Nonomuraea angiospora]
MALDGGEMRLSPPKSRPGKRTISIPAAIIPALTEHLATFVDQAGDAFVFLGKRGAFLRGGNFRREAEWADVLKEMGLERAALIDCGAFREVEPRRFELLTSCLQRRTPILLHQSRRSSTYGWHSP